MLGFNPQSRRMAMRSKINRETMPLLVCGIPWLSIMLGSLTPLWPIIAPAPVVPPFAFLMLLAWRMLRPGVFPLWAGFPLGLFDDLLSGQPLGCAILLFSLTLIALDLLEVQFPWRGFWQNWAIASGAVIAYLVFGALVSGMSLSFGQIGLLAPQFLLSIAVFPMLMSLVAMLDRLRLLRVRRVD